MILPPPSSVVVGDKSPNQRKLLSTRELGKKKKYGGKSSKHGKRDKSKRGKSDKSDKNLFDSRSGHMPTTPTLKPTHKANMPTNLPM